MDEENVIVPLYDGNDEVLTFNNTVTLKVKEANGNHFISITPRQLIAALRSGIQIHIIESSHNGGVEAEVNYVYARLDEITECSYSPDYACFIFDTATHNYSNFSSASLDTYFIENNVTSEDDTPPEDDTSPEGGTQPK